MKDASTDEKANRKSSNLFTYKEHIFIFKLTIGELFYVLVLILPFGCRFTFRFSANSNPTFFRITRSNKHIRPNYRKYGYSLASYFIGFKLALGFGIR